LSHTNRRDVLRFGAAGLGSLVAAGALAGCGKSASGTSAGKTGSLVKASMQLGWIANVENMGEFVADHKGYYKQAGLDLTLIPGGPSVVAEPVVVSGKVLAGLSTSDTVARAVLNGAPLKIVAATLQRNPDAVMSLASNPIRTPHDLIGKRLGMQSNGVAQYDAWFKANGVDPKKVKYVPVQFDPSPLVSRQVDAFASFQTNQPIQLKLKGIDTVSFLLAEYGFTRYADVIAVSDATLADKTRRAQVVQLLKATRHGWQDAIADPDAAADLVVDTYGRSLKLDRQAQRLTAKSEVPLVQNAATRKSGLLTMAQTDIDDNLDTFAALGLKITQQRLFDTSLLAEL
jgi:ABC-type nitrate/sulfonate/bicarbonate transport system substrate-binding protein